MTRAVSQTKPHIFKGLMRWCCCRDGWLIGYGKTARAAYLHFVERNKP